jgi:hypothetical protein
MTRTTSPACPTCGAVTVPIVVGLPSGELFEAADRGEVVLGGCVPILSGPTVVCRGVEAHGWRTDGAGRLVAASGS